MVQQSRIRASQQGADRGSVLPRAERIYQPSATFSEEEEKITNPFSLGRAKINPPRQLWGHAFCNQQGIFGAPLSILLGNFGRSLINQ